MASNNYVKRLSASLIVLRPRQPQSVSSRDTFEVLLVQRSQRMKFASSTWVFPGGVYDKADGGGVDDGLALAEDVDVLRRCALRETFEEAGLLPLSPEAARGAARDPALWRSWRDRIRRDAANWTRFCDTVLHEQRPFSRCEPLCCFLTPERESVRIKRQYLTHFFVCQLAPEDAAPDPAPWNCASVDNSETESLQWLSPSEALAQHASGALPMFPPQFYILKRLSSFGSASEALDAAGWFCTPASSPSKLPIIMQPEMTCGGWLVLPFDEHHGEVRGPLGGRHRVGGFTTDRQVLELDMNELAASLVCGSEGLQSGKWRWSSNPASRL